MNEIHFQNVFFSLTYDLSAIISDVIKHNYGVSNYTGCVNGFWVEVKLKG